MGAIVGEGLPAQSPEFIRKQIFMQQGLVIGRFMAEMAQIYPRIRLPGFEYGEGVEHSLIFGDKAGKRTAEFVSKDGRAIIWHVHEIKKLDEKTDGSGLKRGLSGDRLQLDRLRFRPDRSTEYGDLQIKTCRGALVGINIGRVDRDSGIPGIIQINPEQVYLGGNQDFTETWAKLAGYLQTVV